MKKIVLIITAFLVLVFTISLISKNMIVNNTKNLLNSTINSFYDYVNKYDYGNSGVINITANYKGAHGSTNPINFLYNFKNSYDNGVLYTTFESNDGYYTNEITSSLLDIFMKIKNNDTLKEIFSIKNEKIEFNKIVLILDENKLNTLLNTNYKDFKLIINTNLLFLGVSNYQLVFDDNNLSITNDFKKIYNNDYKIEMINDGYNLSYKDFLKVNYSDNVYNITNNNCIFNIQMGNNIKVRVNKEVNIYNGLELDIEFKNIELNKKSEINRDDIPLFKYFDNAGIRRL